MPLDESKQKTLAGYELLCSDFLSKNMVIGEAFYQHKLHPDERKGSLNSSTLKSLGMSKDIMLKNDKLFSTNISNIRSQGKYHEWRNKKLFLSESKN